MPSNKRRARTILSFDGGGVRGAISIAFARRIEELLRQRDAVPDTTLSDYFDLIGGTSTGAIIASALSLGAGSQEVDDGYRRWAPGVFRAPWFRLLGIQARFDERELRRELTGFCGDRTLDTPDLRTYLAVVTKRVDTGSTWIITNNPRAPYWQDSEDGKRIGNRHYRLADVVRASTAAPHFFAPEQIAIVDGEPPGFFVDGAISTSNDPALALLLTATIPAHGFGWSMGRDDLVIISIGTGAIRHRLGPRRVRRMTSAGLAIRSLQSMITDTERSVLTQMQLMGHTDTAWIINSEIGDLSGFKLVPEPLFTYQRFNVRLDREWLADELGVSLSERAVSDLQRIDNVAMLNLAFEIGYAAAEKFVRAGCFDLVRRRDIDDLDATEQ